MVNVGGRRFLCPCYCIIFNALADSGGCGGATGTGVEQSLGRTVLILQDVALSMVRETDAAALPPDIRKCRVPGLSPARQTPRVQAPSPPQRHGSAAAWASAAGAGSTGAVAAGVHDAGRIQRQFLRPRLKPVFPGRHVTLAVGIDHLTATSQLPTGPQLFSDFVRRHSLGDVPDQRWKACVKALLSAKFSAKATSPTGSGVRVRSSRATA